MRFKKFISVVLSVSLILSLAANLTFNVSAAVLKVAYIDGTDVAVRKTASTKGVLLDRISDRSVTVVSSTSSWIKVKYIGNENDSNSKDTYGKEVTGYIRNSSKDTWVKVVEYDFDADFEAQLEKFPETYHESLKALHEKYPNWKFIPDFLDLTFYQAVALQDVGMRKQVNTTKLSWRSMRDGSYSWSTGKWVSSNGGWYGASREVIYHYMDPRNFLNADEIYMYMTQSYDQGVYTEEGLKKIVKGTFLEKGYSDPDNKEGYKGSYIKVIMEAGKQSGVSPYIIASKIIQEQGVNGTSSLISGNYNTTYKGYYNFFNFKASGSTTTEVITNGLKYAKTRGWNTRSKAIIEGAKEFGLGYIENGQDTYFYQDYNLHFPETGINHQYAQAVHDAYSKGYSLRKFYAEDTESELVFKIPVYKSIPTKLRAKPAQNDKRNNYYFTSIKVNGLTPTFNKFNYKYDLSVDGDTVIDVKHQSSASLVSDKEFALKKGENTVVLKIKAQSGYSTSYTISVNASKACNLYINTGDSSSNGNSSNSSSSSGSSSGSTSSDSTPAVKKGDINGDGKITVSDAANIRLHLLGKYTLKGDSFTAGDINKDGKITVSDAANIRLHLLGKYTIK